MLFYSSNLVLHFQTIVELTGDRVKNCMMKHTSFLLYAQSF